MKATLISQVWDASRYNMKRALKIARRMLETAPADKVEVLREVVAWYEAAAK